MTDAAKGTIWQAVYEPYGRVFSITGAATQNLGLPGQWFQLETGLNYNWHRHYDASLARYTSPDPLGFVDGPAVYAYAGGAPHVKTDKDGLKFGAPVTSLRSLSACIVQPAASKRKSPTYHCQSVICGAPHGGSSDPNFNVCPDCATKNAKGTRLLLENGLSVPPGTLREPGK
jgi:RHS repeat-associated protein